MINCFIIAFSFAVLMSNLLSAYLVSLPGMSFSLPMGLFLYPLTLLISKLVNECFGAEKARQMVGWAIGMNLLAFGGIQLLLRLPIALPLEKLAIGGWMIIGSLAVYRISQFVDIALFASLREWTKERHLWLRNNLSTLLSQILDTSLIAFIHIFLILNIKSWDLGKIFLFFLCFKIGISFLMTPLLYWGVLLMRVRNSPCAKEEKVKIMRFNNLEEM